MGSMLTVELPVQPVAQADEEAAPADGRAVAVLGVGMAILGTIRVVCEIAVYSGACSEALASGLIASRGWGWFLNANPPFSLAVSAWPLLLGLALLRTRWRELVRAGALTFLVLSVGGLLAAVADWSQSSGHWIALGSFWVPKTGWSRLPAAGKAMGIAGAAQLLLELVTAAAASVLAFRRDRDDAPADRRAAARRSRFSRLALYASVAFLVLTIRLPAWSTYLELLNQSQWIREFILRDDLARLRSTRKAPPPDSEWAARARLLLNEGEQAWFAGRYAAAAENYSHLAALLNAIPTASMSPGERRLAARSHNNWAWLLATCPDTGLRNHEDSVKYARRALELEPKDGSTWNTLGVAYFRLGAWDDALNALYRSMELRDEGEGDSNDWFFLAMIHERLGHKERAREWYDMAMKWARAVSPDNEEELYRFAVEAAETLGLPKPDRLPPPALRRPGPGPLSPPPFPGRRGRMGPRALGTQQWPAAAGPSSTPVRRPRSLL
jgi:tetratricopeptide (TPR) repeat protein